MPELWQLASGGNLAGVKAAIEAGANLEETDFVRGTNQQCTRPSPPPPFHSVLTTRLLPHHAAPPHSEWRDTASKSRKERLHGDREDTRGSEGSGRSEQLEAVTRCEQGRPGPTERGDRGRSRCRGEGFGAWNQSTARPSLPPSFHSMDHVHTPPPPSRHFSL